MIHLFSPVGILVIFDQENGTSIPKSFPTRFMVGGRARLVRLAVNHQKVISGSRIWSPRDNSIMRL